MENKINILWKWWTAAQEEQKEAEQKNEKKEEQQTQYQDAEEMNIKEEEIPLTTYKAINDEVAERQDKLEKQIEQIGRMLMELLKNGQAAIVKKKQQSHGQ
ncbi:1462_t:CDS:1 [Acaulospora morrowiae]|uniref:1462_t:CDS:1 n=1 Tax=Acaulospora morrowiae TaxID=94023 RepID=A0A9N9JNB4_9GLOM|nr:1462_t:CDS:1 [Acaulospora morrowiae]